MRTRAADGIGIYASCMLPGEKEDVVLTGCNQCSSSFLTCGVVLLIV